MSGNPQPCPFCGGTDIEMESYNGRTALAICRQCGTSGPIVADQGPAKAWERWNTRQAADRVAPLEEDAPPIGEPPATFDFDLIDFTTGEQP